MKNNPVINSTGRIGAVMGFLLSCLFAAALPPSKDLHLIYYLNQVGFDLRAPKEAVVQTDIPLPAGTSFAIIDSSSGQPVFSGRLGGAQQIIDWAPGRWFYPANFSGLQKPGTYQLKITVNNQRYISLPFIVDEHDLHRRMISAIIHYYHQQRANTPEEWKADEHVKLNGSEKTVDMRGGWCDASGDVSKYFSHLAYANFMSPQQIPLVTWSLANTEESIPDLLNKWEIKDSVENEALWGADYMMRALSPSDYFYMIVFSYFNKDPGARRVVGLRANSVTTDEYACAFREGGGMAIAALARISRWKKNGSFSSAQYLGAAERAFAHLLINNTRYDDDGKENIIDDYCALMAATELWIATDSLFYRDQARKRAENLSARMTDKGYFLAGDFRRPFWHASDAGLPVVALSRYAAMEKDSTLREKALNTIRRALDYHLRVSNEVSNPFGYARQTFLYRDSLRDGFFIPHENETGWWWQGENARLASLATAALVGGKFAYPRTDQSGTRDSLTRFAFRQMSWILGCNPYSICFMYQFGRKNVPYMQSNFGHGSEKGGISNGITGNKNHADGSGIDFLTQDEGNEWRWTEQWLPHAAWFLQVLTETAKDQ
jgi:hypothetical protein